MNAKLLKTGQVEVSLTNPANGPVSFFNRVSLVDSKTKKRVLPVFYDDNYFSILPGADKKILIDYYPEKSAALPVITLTNYVGQEQTIQINP
ncbi:hypothetical protein [Pedobacter sp. NJ-S-72]